jgi:hypothetical protein
MKTIIATAVLALCTAGCSASFKAGSTSDTHSPDGKPIGNDDSDMGKPTADNDEMRGGDMPDKSDDGDTPKSELAAPPPTSTMKDGDCVPGKAKGHTKDKAQGEAKGHDKPPCPDEPGTEPEPVKEPKKSSAKAKADAASDEAEENASSKSAVKSKSK